MTQNFVAEVGCGIDSHENAYITCQIWTANTAWKVIYINLEVSVPDPALYAAPCSFDIIQSDLRGPENFHDVTTAAETHAAQLNYDVVFAIAHRT